MVFVCCWIVPPSPGDQTGNRERKERQEGERDQKRLARGRGVRIPQAELKNAPVDTISVGHDRGFSYTEVGYNAFFLSSVSCRSCLHL